MIDPAIVTALKAKQTKEILDQHSISRGAFDLNKALASAQERLAKAIELFEAGAVTPFGSSECAFIAGEYLVTREAKIVGCSCSAEVHCQCSDHQHRKGRCKHILAAGLFIRASKKEKEGCNV